LLIAAILLAPIWLVPYPPLIDYPNHLARAFVLAHLGDANFHFNGFYTADWNFYPYLTMDMVLVAMQSFLSIEMAGRVFLSFCVLALPLATLFFLRQANPGHDRVALWSLLVSYNTWFLFGFLSQVLSTSLCFLALGLWLRHGTPFRPLRWFCLLLVTTALYFTHLIGFGVAALVVLGYSLLTRRTPSQIAAALLLFVPGVAFFFLASRAQAPERWGAVFTGFGDKVIGLSSVVRGYSTPLDLLTLLILAGCCFGVWWRNREFGWNHRWVGITAGLLGLYWLFPSEYGAGADSDRRVLVFIFVLTLAVARVGQRARVLAPIIALLFAVRMANVAQVFLAEQPKLASLAESFAVVPRGARVLPIVQRNRDRFIRADYLHFWSYGVIQKGWLSPYLFHDIGVQPLRIQTQAYHPFGLGGDIRRVRPDWKRVRENYDYVWAYNASFFSAQLAEIGELVFENGHLRVYRVKRAAVPPKPAVD
jgi:hypothetical protein